MTASLAATVGLDAGLVAVGDAILALVDTGIPIEDALAAHPDLQPLMGLLGEIAHGGTLWIALDTMVAAGEPSPLAWSINEAIRILASADLKSADIWRTTAPPSGSSPTPVPFPLMLPSALGPSSAEDALNEVIEGLRGSVAR